MDKEKGGVSFLGILMLIFITLKLMGTITWSWLWVLSPLWLPLAILFTVMILIVLVDTFINIIRREDD